MSNPFLHISPNNIGEFAVQFTTFIKDQLIKLEIGQSARVDTREKSVANTRMTIRHISNENFKFSTKTDEHGSLWVLRIK